VTLAAGETFTQSFTRKVNRGDVGSYSLTFTAADSSESATATANTTVVKK
jgi:phage head maturation protease